MAISSGLGKAKDCGLGNVSDLPHKGPVSTGDIANRCAKISRPVSCALRGEFVVPFEARRVMIQKEEFVRLALAPGANVPSLRDVRGRTNAALPGPSASPSLQRFSDLNVFPYFEADDSLWRSRPGERGMSDQSEEWPGREPTSRVDLGNCWPFWSRSGIQRNARPNRTDRNDPLVSPCLDEAG